MAEYRLIKGSDVLYVIVDEKDDKRYEELFPYSFLKVVVKDWNNDLSPWRADPVFGKEGFGGKAESFSRELLSQVKMAENITHPVHAGICGYSLAGLFVLWQVTRTDMFQYVLSASGSLWFPGFTDYLEKHPVYCKKAYLSLGKKEPLARNPVMKTVGQCTEKAVEILSEQCRTTFEWNEGGHYANDFQRVSRGIRWLEGTESLS